MHFFLILWYAYPLNRVVKSKLDYYAFDYGNPYFYQDWRMFTPGPKNNYTLYAIYEVNDQTHYTLPIQEVLYQRNALNGREFLNLSFTNSCSFIHANAFHVKNNIYRFNNDKYYTVLQHATLQYLRKKHHGNITNLKLILEIKHIQTKEKVILIE